MRINDLYDEYRASERINLNIGESTLNCEERFYVDYIAAIIGDKEADEVTEDEFVAVAKRARAQGRQRDSLISIRRIIYRIYEYGIRKGYLSVNRMELAADAYMKFTNTPMYSKETISRIEDAFGRMPLGNLYGFVAAMRCNAADACALSEDSVLLEEGVCFLDHILVGFDANKEPIIEQKTSGMTWSNLNDKAKHYVSRQIKLQALNKRRAGDNWHNPYNLLFTDGYGNALNKEVIRKSNEQLIALSNVPKLTLDRLKNLYKEMPER